VEQENLSSPAPFNCLIDGYGKVEPEGWGEGVCQKIPAQGVFGRSQKKNKDITVDGFVLKI